MNLSIALPIAAIIISSSFTTAFIAKLTGRKISYWFWLGVLLPILSWFILLVLPVKKEKTGLFNRDEDFFNDIF